MESRRCGFVAAGSITVVDSHADQVSYKYAGIGLRKNF